MKTIRMEDIMMNIDFLKKYVTNGIWETEDLRAYKTDLLLMAQQGQKKFKPLKKEMYSGNKIQIIDFFSGELHLDFLRLMILYPYLIFWVAAT